MCNIANYISSINKDDISLVFSGIALSLSIFTFYWLNIRERKCFYLLRIDNPLNTDMLKTPEFAFINSGSKDIFVTSISCCFRDKGSNSGFIPKQKTYCNEGNAFLLQAGRAFHCKVEFIDPFTASFALTGERIDSADKTYYHYAKEMTVDIDWVDSHGDIYSSSCKTSKYGFDEHGAISRFWPLQKKHNLYQKT